MIAFRLLGILGMVLQVLDVVLSINTIQMGHIQLN